MGSFHGIRELYSSTVHLSMRTFGVSHEYLLGFLKGSRVPPCKEVTLSKRTPQIHSVSVLLRHGNGQRRASTTFAHHSIYTVQRKPIVTLGTTQIVILLVVLGGTKHGASRHATTKEHVRTSFFFRLAFFHSLGNMNGAWEPGICLHAIQ